MPTVTVGDTEWYSLTIRIKPDTAEHLKAVAAREERAVGAVIRRLLEDAVRNSKERA